MSKALKSILYIAIPVLLVGAAITWMMKKRKERKEKGESKEVPDGASKEATDTVDAITKEYSIYGDAITSQMQEPAFAN